MEKRKWYPTKAQWAAAKARELREQASRIRAESIPSGEWRRVRGKMATLERLSSEAAKFDRIAGRDFDDGPSPF